RKTLPLAFARGETPQALHLVLQLGALGFARGVLLLGFGDQLLEALPFAVGGGCFRCEGFAFSVRVEKRALCRRAHQGLVRMLAVNVDGELARLAQLRKRGCVAIDEAARAAAAIEGAAKEQTAGIALELAGLEPGRQLAFGKDVELRGELGTLAAFAHHAGLGPAADEKLDRVDEQRLPGAGFPRERREPCAELEGRALDDDEIPDFERTQHGYSGSRFFSSASLQ